MNTAETIRTLRDAPFLDEVREHLAAWGDEATPERIDEAIEWMAGFRDELVRGLELVGETEDAAMLCAVKHIELTARWIGLNSLINYSLMQQGACDPQAALRGAALSALIDHVERLLPDRAVASWHTILAEPLSARVRRVLADVSDPDQASTTKPKGRGRSASRHRKARDRKAA